MFIFDICFKVSFYFFIFFLFFGAFQGFNEIYFVFFSFAHCAVWTRHCLCLHRRQERWLFFYAFWATCLPLVEKVRSATCLLVVWVGVALHQLSHTYCENVGAALWLLADGRGRVGGSDGLNAHLPLTYAGGGGNGGGVVAECTPTIGRLGSERD